MRMFDLADGKPDKIIQQFPFASVYGKSQEDLLTHLKDLQLQELVRQIESKDLRKLRNLTRSRRIKTFIDMSTKETESLHPFSKVTPKQTA